MKRLRAAVIGVGRMGKNHARIYHAMDGVDLVAVVDKHEATAKAVSTQYECQGYMSLRVMLNNLVVNAKRSGVDIASVVTPTVRHLEHAAPLLESGISVLIEKPISHSIEQARRLVYYAINPKLTVAVGHIERCNPAVQAAKELVDKGEIGEIYRVSSRRVGPSPRRIRDVGVTLDLATHDLDIMRYITGKEAIGYKAIIQHRKHNGLDDSLNAIIEFEDGIVGVLESDWLTPAKARTLTIVGKAGMITVDYGKQETTLYHRPDTPIPVVLVRKEPLKDEIERFVSAVRGDGEPAATAFDGYMAVQMAIALRQAGR